MSLMSRKLTISSQLSKQLIHSMDHSIAENKLMFLDAIVNQKESYVSHVKKGNTFKST